MEIINILYFSNSQFDPKGKTVVVGFLTFDYIVTNSKRSVKIVSTHTRSSAIFIIIVNIKQTLCTILLSFLIRRYTFSPFFKTFIEM